MPTMPKEMRSFVGGGTVSCACTLRVPRRIPSVSKAASATSTAAMDNVRLLFMILFLLCAGINRQVVLNESFER
jgi:hypothetical protein